jgi:NAD(P)-dependent dehydrogenase (short-subunit alcohol dehydrogenase family)
MKEIPMRRVAAAIEMARPIIFMASDLASYMTGRSIIVDGGWTKDLA